MATDVLDGLKDVDFAVLNHLLDASVGREVDADPGGSIPVKCNHMYRHYRHVDDAGMTLV